MKILKRIIASIMFLVMAAATLKIYNQNTKAILTSTNSNKPIKINVLFSNFNVNVISSFVESMKKSEEENPDKIQYTFFDGKGNQDVQNTQLNTILAEKNFDFIILDMVDVGYTRNALDRIKENNVSVLFFGNADLSQVMSYEKAHWLGFNPNDGGVVQGKIVVDAFYKNKKNIDKNNDNILQYVMLEGTPDNVYAIGRTKYSIKTINDNDIKTQELARKICDWNEDEARVAVKSFFLQFGNKIEAIIANDDIMAIGAIKAIQEQGFNLSNSSPKMMVVGFDGIEEAKILINDGIMTGTVITSSDEVAKTFFNILTNLFNNRNPIENTNCTIDSTGKIITIPYNEVLVNLG